MYIMKPFVTVCLLAVCSNITWGVLVQTKHGPVQGQTLSLNNGKQVNSYLGVPFAKPPVGKLRWRAPEDPTSWKEPFKADRIRSACPQANPGLIYITHLFWDDYSEDCMHLNIYTPKDMSRGPYPVMVWFYGGGYAGGANFQYPGYFLADKDIIMVAPNYRLGALGFASTLDPSYPGNYGILDQQKALQFVKDNIKNFGGDPNKVTIAGQSAGGASVGIQTLSPAAKGLFHQAIFQSGFDVATWAVHGKEQKPWNYTVQLATKLSCPTTDIAAMMDCLREKPASEIIDFKPTCTPGFVCLGFSPVVDGKVIPDSPSVLRNRSDFAKVPTMAGITQNDGSLIATVLKPEMLFSDGLTKKEFSKILSGVIGQGLTGYPDLYDAVYNAFKFYYTAWGQEDNKGVNRERISQLVTDAGFGYPCELTNEYSAASSPTYKYVLKYLSANASEIFPEWLGVTHVLDIPYVFGQPFLFDNIAALDESKITHSVFDWTKDDENMSEFMMTLWTNFVKTGNPTPRPVSLPGNPPVTWKAYEAATKETFVINTKVSHEARYRQRAYAFFTEYLPYLLSK